MNLRAMRLRAREEGVAAVEFALVSPVMILMLLGLFDIGHLYYASSVLQGAVQKAARDATLESGPEAVAELDDQVEESVRKVVGEDLEFTSERLSYANFADVGDAELFIDAEGEDGSPGNGIYDPGDCFEDRNGNRTWDPDLGLEGQGGAQDVVLYRVNIEYSRLFPLGAVLGWGDKQSISASTVLRNQPYDDQSTSPVEMICPAAAAAS